MAVRFYQDKVCQENRINYGKKEAEEPFLRNYRELVPDKLSWLSPISINEWRKIIDEVDEETDLTTSLKVFIINGVSSKRI